MKALVLVLVGSELALVVALYFAVRMWIRYKAENKALYQSNSDLRYCVEHEQKNVRRLRETIDELKKAEARKEIKKSEPPPTGDSAARLARLNRMQDQARKGRS